MPSCIHDPTNLKEKKPKPQIFRSKSSLLNILTTISLNPSRQTYKTSQSNHHHQLWVMIGFALKNVEVSSTSLGAKLSGKRFDFSPNLISLISCRRHDQFVIGPSLLKSRTLTGVVSQYIVHFLGLCNKHK